MGDPGGRHGVLALGQHRRGLPGASGDGNVILHEFAHQIDVQRDLTSGAAVVLANRYRDWAELLQVEKSRQRAARAAGRPRCSIPMPSAVEERSLVATKPVSCARCVFKTGHPELYREVQAVWARSGQLASEGRG